MKTTIRGVVAPLTAALALLSGPVSSQETPQLRLTLNEAVERALRVSPVVAQSEGAVRTAESAERSALGAFLPSLSLSTGASRSSTERFNPTTNTTVSGSQDSYSAGLSSSLTLFQAGRRLAERSRTAAQTVSAEAGLIEQRFAVALSAKQTFLTVLRAEETVRVNESRVTRAEESLGAAERRIQVGSATQSDRLRAQLELNQAKQALLTAQADRRNAEFALGRLVGTDGPVAARPLDNTEPRPLAMSDEQLVQLVTSRSPQVATAEATLRANQASVRVAKTQYFPSITASGGYDWFNQDPQLNGGRLSWSTRLSLSYPLFNQFQREDAVERANVNAINARYTLEDTRRAVRAELQSALSTLRLAEEQIALAQEAVRVANEDLRVQQERYRVGVATMLDQLTSQTAVVEAENNLVAARYDYQIARAQVEALAGREL